MNTVTLPWPPKELSPNARVHWSKRARAAKAYRMACYAMVRAAGLTAGGEKIALRIVFVPPSRRRYDDDNLLASFKAGRDGLADALGVDDRAFVTTLSVSGDVVSGGAVIVTVGDER